MKRFLSISAMLISSSAFCQDSNKVAISYNGFIDAYYAVDEGSSSAKSGLFYNHTARNQISVNMAMFKAAVEHERFRANVGLMAGTYVENNLAHEPEALQHLWEANAGYRLADKLWVDAGIFASHLGFESAISTQNLALSRSLVAENSPYYLSGVNLTYAPNDQWTILFNVSNGWQLMRDNNKHPAFGTQIQFSPNDVLTFNSSTFIGREVPGSTRYFHDFYTIVSPSDKISFIGCFDYGFDVILISGDMQDWYGWAFIGQFAFTESISVSARAEQFSDPFGRATTASSSSAYSINLDWNPIKNVFWRVELKNYVQDLNHPTAADIENTFGLTSLAIEF